MIPKDLLALQKIHQLMRSLESGTSEAFEVSAVVQLQDQLRQFAGHEDLNLQKISEIAKHLRPDMTMKHYVSWIVPVERLLQKELRDDEFMVYSADGARTVIEKIPMVFVLHNLRSAFNVGSIFRTAECFGASKIYLCGYTPLPTQEKLAKTAMGTDSLLEWEERAKLPDLIADLKQQGYQVVALETTSHARSLQESFLQKPTAFVLGNERFGIDAEILELCSETRKIPLRGQKNSLNVGVATAVAAYEYSRQWSDAASSAGQ